MKPLIASLIAIIIVLVAGLGYFYLKSTNSSAQIAATPIPTSSPISTPSPVAASPTTTTSLFCNPSELQTTITGEGAAGSVYLSVNIKNTSTSSCQIVGNKFIEATSTAHNITVKQQGQPNSILLTLDSGQIIYSQIRYQNGPQCSGPTTQTPISYTYPISPTDSLPIKDSTNSNPLTIRVCSSASEKTTLDVWSLSAQALNQ